MGCKGMAEFTELESRLEEEPKVTAKNIKELSFHDRLKIHAALTHNTRLNILKYLLKNDGASFSRIKGEFDLNPNTLTYHLKILEYAGLIHSEYSKNPNTREYSKYYITPLGKEMLKIDDYTKWL
jgi:predicted transcriptional regulator